MATPETIKRRAYHQARYLAKKDAINARATAWAKANREHVNELARRRRSADPERHRAAIRRWQKTHPDRARASTLQWLAKRPDYHRLYRAAHRLHNALYKRAYAAANPLVGRLAAHNRRARFRSTPVNDLTKAQAQAVVESAHGVCVYCPYYNPGCKLCSRRRHKLSIDHITAISRGGPHTLHNLAACCRTCNNRKHTKPNPVPVQPLLL